MFTDEGERFSDANITWNFHRLKVNRTLQEKIKHGIACSVSSNTQTKAGK